MGLLRKRVGHFFLVEQIGSGGSAEVYLGINPRTRERRAFKILKQRATTLPWAHTRFLRDVDLLRSLSHPGIIRILDNGTIDNCQYYSMEFMPGGNLNRRLERVKIPMDEALSIFVAMCEAIANAHEQAVTHGNLKPSNILFKANGKPVVTDFGISSLTDQERIRPTRKEQIMGNIAYLAPEQRYHSTLANRRADVYALGAILYEMVMGFPPLGSFPRPLEVQPGLPLSLNSVLEKCLAPDPHSRFEHAGVLKIELKMCPDLRTTKKTGISGNPFSKGFLTPEDLELPPTMTDRIEAWFRVLRSGTTRERLAGVREMVEEITPAEAKAVLKLYAEEGDRVRWGLIRVLGELKIEAATPLILNDLSSPFHTECAIEALGKIGSEEAYSPIQEYLLAHPEYTSIALTALAKTGKQRALKYLRHYLSHEAPAIRQSAAQAIAAIGTTESLRAMKEHLCVERDEEVRSHLLQAIHSLQPILPPDPKVMDPCTEAAPHVQSI